MCVLRRNEVYREKNPLNQNMKRIVGLTDEEVFSVKCSKEKQNSVNLPVAENRREFENKVDKKELWVTADPYANCDSSRAGEEYLEQGRKNYQVILFNTYGTSASPRANLLLWKEWDLHITDFEELEPSVSEEHEEVQVCPLCGRRLKRLSVYSIMEP